MSTDHESLISAYFDGELSAADATEVGSSIEDDAGREQEHDEIAKLSNILQSQPQHMLDEQFAAEVMQSAERSMLLPATPAKKSRGRLYAVSSIVAGVAAAVIVVPMLRQYSPVSFDNASSEIAMTAAQSFDESPSAKTVASDFAAAEMAEEADAGLVEFAPSAGAIAGGEDLVFDENLNSANVGDVIEALVSKPDQISVIRLTVVDRIEALDKLQVILSRNRITTEQPSAADQPASDRDSEDELLAVYVEADTRHLSLALSQLEADEEMFKSMDLGSDIQVASLEPKYQQRYYMKQKLAGGGSFGGGGPVNGTQEHPTRALNKSMNLAKDKKENSKELASKTAERKSPETNATNKPAEPSSRAPVLSFAEDQRNYRMSIPSNLVRRRMDVLDTAPAGNAISEEDQAVRRQTMQPGLRLGASGSKRIKARPVQLLIVLVENEDEPAKPEPEPEDGSGAA